ncbi:hypothetical protein MP638_002033 [Amoeboaphelidium occidentale]|nr:hypothetical protein MP638_002033 [Amoeboaphelidium occidentale]
MSGGLGMHQPGSSGLMGTPILTDSSYYRDQVDRVLRENKQLRTRMEQLEKENVSLKKSVFDLTNRISELLRSNTSTSKYFMPEPSIDVSSYGVPGQRSQNEAAHYVGSTIGSPVMAGSSVSSSFMNGLQKQFTATSEHVGEDLAVLKGKQSFVLKHEIKSHSGAVYVVKHSPNGMFMASGSFDKTVRVFDCNNDYAEVQCFKKHSLNVSDLTWLPDSTEVISGSFDQTCKIFNLEEGRMVHSVECEGFLQCVEVVPSDPALFWSSTSKKIIVLNDRRKPNPALVVRNDGIINCMHVYNDSSKLLTGDSSGCLKTWDFRTGQLLNSYTNETKSPISSFSFVRTSLDQEEHRFMAVNSYDNVVRVYDRGDDIAPNACRLLYEVKGPHLKNWPIKNAFFQPTLQPLQNALGGEGIEGREHNDRYILASGSSDANVYLYSVKLDQLSRPSSRGVGKVEIPTGVDTLQVLQGHSDRVYGVSFHPRDLSLASSSSDFSIRIWKPRTKQ